jgi:hypothetical protein
MKLHQLGTLAFFTLGLTTACGSGVDIDRLRADFDNPSGSVANKDAVLAATMQKNASGPALALGSGGLPGALSVDGRSSALANLSRRSTMERRARAVLEQRLGRGADGLSRAALAEAGGCDDAAAAMSAWTSLGAGGGSASYELDLSACSGGELTGKVSVEIEVDGDIRGGTVTLEQTFVGVCEVGGRESCLDGTMVMEAKGDQSGFQFTIGWNFDARWNEGGRALATKTKGGMRMGGTEQSASFEYLVYVTAPDGTEYSFIFELSADDSGARFAIRGEDGKIECTVDAEGAGMCTGTGGSVSWTAEELAALDGAWLED